MAGRAAGNDEYDVVVLGTGAAGLTAAERAAAGGARVGLFEKAGTVGGTARGPAAPSVCRTAGTRPRPGSRTAAGNAMGSVMGMTYGGHGGTLGPALVFGYRAGRHAAARAAARRW
jgi:succinate dehydrogenase/fumarate reductase flavoprotein subunit